MASGGLCFTNGFLVVYACRISNKECVMADCPRPLKICDEQVLVEASKPECPDWDCCLPFGGRLYQRDGCVRYIPGTPPEDGVYGTFTVQNGCIVAAAPEEVAKYQSDSCAPVPCPCSEDSDTGGSVCDPSATVGNLYTCDSAGKPLVLAYVNGGNNVSVTGNGTQTNPFNISVDTGAAGIAGVRSDNVAITVTTDDDGMVTIAHRTGWNNQTVNGITFDQFGHAIDYSDSSASGSIQGVIGANGVKVTTDNSTRIATVELMLPANALEGEYVLGGYRVTLDHYNNIYAISKEITDTEGTYPMGAFNVTLNEYGSIETVTGATTDGTITQGLFTLNDPSVVRRELTFNMRFTSQLVVEIETRGVGQDWGDQLTIRLDGSVQSNRLVTVASRVSVSGASPNQTVSVTDNTVKVLVSPASLYTAGDHTLSLYSPAGFPSNVPVNVVVKAVQAFTSTATYDTDGVY